MPKNNDVHQKFGGEHLFRSKSDRWQRAIAQRGAANLGVFEGNGSDLRIGLSRQSLADGERWVHEPLRLTVVIDGPFSL